ncbi:MAG TPA: response regulator transcription factor [Anaerolineae bacterium]|nr:response regulator transcription factor [Anaerolineae bacterium]HQK15083.1 response regulator transcription factor [Anaerolineae bacterium]
MAAQERILIVDDNTRLVEALRHILEGEGYTVLTAPDGLAALQLMQATCPHLILADIAMPRMNGYQLYERVRENPEWTLIPFLFLTGRGMDSDIRYAKELGADDYLVKPVEPEDLLVAVRGKLKRARQLAQLRGRDLVEVDEETATPALVVGALRIEPKTHRVTFNGNPIALSAREFALLACLADRAGEVVTPQEILHCTHGYDADYEEASALLRPLIRSVRRKLGYAVGELGCIETVRGIGYRLLRA